MSTGARAEIRLDEVTLYRGDTVTVWLDASDNARPGGKWYDGRRVQVELRVLVDGRRQVFARATDDLSLIDFEGWTSDAANINLVKRLAEVEAERDEAWEQQSGHLAWLARNGYPQNSEGNPAEATAQIIDDRDEARAERDLLRAQLDDERKRTAELRKRLPQCPTCDGHGYVLESYIDGDNVPAVDGMLCPDCAIDPEQKP